MRFARSSRSLLRYVAGLLGLVACACAGDSTGSPRAEVAGSYVATQLTTTGDEGTVDRLSRGATLTLSLRENGTFTGHLFAPDGADDGGEFDEALEGRWSLTGTTVRFQDDLDTFLRDLDFEVGEGRLTADGMAAGTRFQITLVRR